MSNCFSINWSKEHPLRYYATLKVGKFEFLFYNLIRYFQKTITCLGLQEEQYSLLIFNIYNFCNFGYGFWALFLCYFQKLHFLVIRNFEIIFAALTSICVSSKGVSQIFKILYQTGDISNFVLSHVFLSRYVQLKSSFSDEENISSEIWDTLVEELSKVNMAKYYRKIPSLAEVGAP